MYDVIIIGGGVSGLGAALTLGSCEGSKLGGFKTLVLDNGKSDLKKAKLYNVPYLKQGESGENALEMLKNDALKFKSVSFKNAEVMSVDGKYGEFNVKTEDETYSANSVVLATGTHNLDITLNGENIPTKPHELIPKPGKIRVEYSGRNELAEGLYVAGLLSGVTTMYATALGSGVEVASAIISKKAGKVAVIHDFEGSRA